MDVRQGHVRRVVNGLAWVDIVRSSGCGRCAEAGGCGQACSARPTTYVIPVTQAVEAGDQVSVSVPQGAPLVAALMTYGIGLAAMMAGALLARFLVSESDPAIAAGAAAGLLLSVLWLRRAQPRATLLPVIAATQSLRHPSDS